MRSPRARSVPRGRRGEVTRPECGGWPRPGPVRGRRAAPSRSVPATSTGSPARPSIIAQSSGRPPADVVATSAGMPASASSRSSARSPASASSRSKMTTAASAPIPKGRRRPRSSSASSRPLSASAEDVAGEPPLGLPDDTLAHELERRRRSSPAWRSGARTRPSRPCWLTTTSQATGEPPRRAGDRHRQGTLGQRPLTAARTR